MLADDLFGGWIRARQAAGADCDDTARRLLKFMDEDSYGFSSVLDRSAVKVLDRPGLAAFEREVLARFDKECATGKGDSPVGLNPHYKLLTTSVIAGAGY